MEETDTMEQQQVYPKKIRERLKINLLLKLKKT